MIALAEFFSFIFHPVLFFLSMPFVIVYKQTSSSFYALKWEMFSALFIIAGILGVFLGKKVGIFTDLDLSTRKERHTFYLFIGILSVIYLSTSIFFKGLFFPLTIITIGITIGIIIFELVDFYFKASVHIGVASAWVLAMILLYGNDMILLTIWIIPVLSWSRIRLKKHTPREIFIGGFVGIFITFVTFVLGKAIYK